MEKITMALLVMPENESEFLLTFTEDQDSFFNFKFDWFLNHGFRVRVFKRVDGVLKLTYVL